MLQFKSSLLRMNNIITFYHTFGIILNVDGSEPIADGFNPFADGSDLFADGSDQFEDLACPLVD